MVVLGLRKTVISLRAFVASAQPSPSVIPPDKRGALDDDQSATGTVIVTSCFAIRAETGEARL